MPKRGTQVPFQWKQIHTDAWNILKTKLSDAVLLYHPSSTNCTLTITTDASDFALGGVLHEVGENNKLYPLAFHSRKLSVTECQWSAFDRELLAAYDCTIKFRSLIEGRKVILLTDH